MTTNNRDILSVALRARDLSDRRLQRAQRRELLAYALLLVAVLVIAVLS